MTQEVQRIKDLLKKHEESYQNYKNRLASMGTATPNGDGSNPHFVDYAWCKNGMRQERAIIDHLEEKLRRIKA